MRPPGAGGHTILWGRTVLLGSEPCRWLRSHATLSPRRATALRVGVVLIVLVLTACQSYGQGSRGSRHRHVKTVVPTTTTIPPTTTTTQAPPTTQPPATTTTTQPTVGVPPGVTLRPVDGGPDYFAVLTVAAHRALVLPDRRVGRVRPDAGALGHRPIPGPQHLRVGGRPDRIAVGRHRGRGIAPLVSGQTTRDKPALKPWRGWSKTRRTCSAAPAGPTWRTSSGGLPADNRFLYSNYGKGVILGRTTPMPPVGSTAPRASANTRTWCLPISTGSLTPTNRRA